jgi:hypothetical protein
MKAFPACALAACAVLGALTISGANAETPPYRYCMIGTPNMGMDCLYNTLEQCRVAASAGVGFCQENSEYLVRNRPDAPAPKRRHGG